jgi:hypothetical protein
VPIGGGLSIYHGYMLAAVPAATLLFLHFLYSHKENEAKESARKLRQFLLRKTADGLYRFRLVFRFAKRPSAQSTAIAYNLGFLILTFRQSRKQELTFNARLKGGL